MATPTAVQYRRLTSGPVAGGRSVFAGQAAAVASTAAALAVQKMLAAAAAAAAAAGAGAAVVKGLGGAAAGVASAVGGLAVFDGILQWDAASGATGYRLYWGTSPGSYAQAPGEGLEVGNVTSYELASLSLTAGVTYYVAVRANNGAGAGAESGDSNVIQVRDGVQIA